MNYTPYAQTASEKNMGQTDLTIHMSRTQLTT